MIEIYAINDLDAESVLLKSIRVERATIATDLLPREAFNPEPFIRFKKMVTYELSRQGLAYTNAQGAKIVC